MKAERRLEARGGTGRAIVLGALSFIALAGCRDNLRSTPTGAASTMPARPQATTAPVVSEEGAEASAAIDIEGAWFSPSCGERAYARFIRFEAGRFNAEDRVAPCPKGAQCIWSGIVYRSGTYSISGQALRLSIEQTLAHYPGVSFPDELALEEGPVELAISDGGTVIRCAYERR